MPVDPARAKSLFLAASELADPANRAAYVDRECGGDAELRERVEALLRANDAAPLPPVVAATMDSVPGQPQTEDREDPTAQVGAVIAGKYTLAEVIGEGGMGSVWRAKQSEPVKRFVAVKLIKAGMDSRQVLARFDAERQALALMDHPNIAKVLDGGLHERRPFFVMELVKGVPITEYCDAQKLTPQQRLELFVPVCQAIQHAHQKGIIHRDIKPSNVLVALYDDKPVVKVIDFGVAKATGGALTEATIDTGFGSVVGTPEYMSPEQATFNNLDIDTRSDVYALGVLLYELLAGSPPFSKHELEKKGLLEMLRVVREEEPPRPSTKLSTNAALPTLSANRGTEPKKLTGLLRNELDWIVMKALEKDRTRRYETANGFAADVQRYLAGEPVQAHPPSTAYRLKKFVRRNRGQVIAASLVFLTLIAGIAGTASGLVRALDAEAKARRDRDEAITAKNAETEALITALTAQRAEEAAKILEGDARKEAVEQAAITEAVNEFFLKDILSQTGPHTQENDGFRPVPNLTVREAVKRASGKVAERFKDRPLVEAAVRVAIAKAFSGMSNYPEAIAQVEMARDIYGRHGGLETDQAVACLEVLSGFYLAEEKRELAMALCEQLYARALAKFGPDHPNTDRCLFQLALCVEADGEREKAIRLISELIERMRKREQPDFSEINRYRDMIAFYYFRDGRYAEAHAIWQESLQATLKEHGPEHTETVARRTNVAMVLVDLGRTADAVKEYQEVLRIEELKRGPDDAHTFTATANYAQALAVAGRFEEAEKLLRAALKRAEVKLGYNQGPTFHILTVLANSLHDRGRTKDAIPLLEDALGRAKDRYGLATNFTWGCVRSLLICYQATKEYAKAIQLLDDVFQDSEKERGPNHRHTLGILQELINMHVLAGQEADVTRLSLLFQERGGKSTSVAANLGLCFLNQKKPELAIPQFESVVEHLRKQKAPNPRELRVALSDLAEANLFAKRFPAALELLREMLPLERQTFGPSSKETVATLTRIAMVHESQKQWPEAIIARRDAFEAVRSQKGAARSEVRTLCRHYVQACSSGGDLKQSVPALREMATLEELEFGAEDTKTLTTLNNLGVVYWKLNRLDESVPLYERILKIRRRTLGPDHVETLVSTLNLGINYRDAGRRAEAIPLLEQVHRERNKHPSLQTVRTAHNLMQAYIASGKVAEGTTLAQKSVAEARTIQQAGSLQLANALEGSGTAMLQLKSWTEAEKLLRETLTIREGLNPDFWQTFNTQSLLGGALLGQKKYADAEPLLLKGYEGMKAREKTIPPQGKTRIPEALDRLIELYTATDKPDEVKKWQAERAKYPQANAPEERCNAR